MKFDKRIAIILVLLAMLLSAVAVSVYFYNQNKQVLASKNQMVTIFVASKNIKKDTLIKEEHIKETNIARQYILTKPLLKNEILNKYAKESIYQNETFLKEKLVAEIKVEKPKTLDFEYNSYNMSFKLFQNPNFSLQPDDIIKIISVYPETKENDANKFEVQYVANNIRVLGFLMDGYPSNKSIVKRKIKKLVKKKQVEEIVDIKADEIVLDIKQDILLSLIDDYNKGKQLWMVKSKFIEKDKEEEEKKRTEEMMKIKTKVTKTKVLKKYTPKKRSYPVKWYKPKSSSTTKTAVISYANNKDLSQTKKAKIISNYALECSKTDKLLIVVKNRTSLRKDASLRAKKHKTVYKNYILPYRGVSKINPNWYILCDGTYVNSEDVTIISYQEYKKLR